MSRSNLIRSDFNFPNQLSRYNGKVRDVYTFQDNIVMIVSDRISAFDHILPRPIPYKGQVLNGIAQYFLESTRDIVPNWFIASPHPNVSIGKRCQPIRIEMVIRNILAGHAWREYKSGKRELCGVRMPEGMKEGDMFPNPIITPATKAEEGHDEDISREDILSQGIVRDSIYRVMEKYTRDLFTKGCEMAKDRGLILVDTKYEFGLDNNGDVLLIDEVHTPDSSRFYILDGYQQRQENGERQHQLSKEFVREWLMSLGFQGKSGQVMPAMPDRFMNEVTDKYIALYEKITGASFIRRDYIDINTDIEQAVINYF